jgi:soluble lytic murein transglycosylase-like protein
MRRSIVAALALTVAGCLLVWFYAPPGKPGRGVVPERARSRPAPPNPVTFQAGAGKGLSAAPAPEAARQPAAKIKGPGAARSAPASPGNQWASRAPAQVANVVRDKNLEAVIDKYAQKYGVDADLVWVVIRQESGFNPRAVSPKGAMGLMQLMPGTAALMGVSNAFDVEQNIAGGIKYLERCLNRFNQDVGLALAAYNAGPENVVKYQGCPPFPETRQYVASILQAYAGEPVRGDRRFIGSHPVMAGDLLGVPAPQGLPWRIPLPRWRIAAPNCKLGAPHWKLTLRPF